MENDIRLEDLHPTYRQISEVIGIENTIKLGRELGGESFYLPKLGVCLARVKERKVVEEVSGGNYVEVARKYGVTSSWVRQILKKHRRKAVSNVG